MAEALWGPALLFCPGDRPERFVKAAERADAVIVDLEDAVAPKAKAAARDNLVAAQLDPHTTLVRINAADSPDRAADVAAARTAGLGTVVAAKCRSTADLADLADFQVVPQIESAQGVLNAVTIAAQPNVVGLLWGAEDLIASLGGFASRRPDGSYCDVIRHARSQLHLAAAAAHKPFIDAIYTAITDLDGLRSEADAAAASGCAAKACIHPTHVPIIRAAFWPTPERVGWARRIFAQASEAGASRVSNEMIDDALLLQARRILSYAHTVRPDEEVGQQ